MADSDETPSQNNAKSSGTASPDRETSTFRSYCRIFRYTDRTGWCLNLVSLLCMIASGTLLPLMDLVFGKFVTIFNNFATGAASPDEFRSGINEYTYYFLYLFAAKFALTYTWTTLISINAIRTTRALRIDFLRQTLRQEVGFFDSEAGSIAGHVTTNANLVNQGISEKLGLAIQALSTFCAAFIVAFAVQWKLTLITICVVPAIIIITGICMAIDTKQETQIMSIYSRAGRLAEEAFSSMRTVHAFWVYPKLSRKYEAILDEARTVGAKKSPNFAVLFSAEFFCVYSGYGLAFWQGIRMYSSGEISQPGRIVTVIFAVLLAAQALTLIAPQTVVISKSAAAAHSMFETIDRESKIDSLSGEGRKPDKCHGEIQFRNVTFAYPSRPDVEVLKGLDLQIPANRTTAIVGASGSGKSTVIGLIERWFSPQSGTVILDGRRVEEYNPRWLRTSEPVLFNGTVFQNVAYGLSGTRMAGWNDTEKLKLVEDACRSAFAHEFVETLPEGYHTQVGERGAMLSGGQKQRLAIARSVISNPRVLLLDEATSALDPNAERIVQKALNNVAADRTTVVIAHRLSTIRDAENIVVMSNGLIVEQGTHDELVACQGAYFRLVRAQDLGKDRDESDSTETEKGREEDGEYRALRESPAVAADVNGTSQFSSLAPSKAEKQYDLLKCLAIIGREQTCLWPIFALVSVGCIVGGATYPALAILLAHTMDTFALTGSAMTERGDFFALMFFVVAIGNLLAYAAMGWLTNVISQHIIKYYRLEIFNSVLRQNMEFFDKVGNTTGALVSHLSQDPQSLQELLSFNIAIIMVIVINLVSSCVLAIVTGWKLGLVLTFGALPPLVFSGYLKIRLELKLDNDTSSRFADSTNIASEAVMAIRTVSSLALEQTIIDNYEVSLRSIATKSVHSLGWTMFWYSLSQSISFLAMALGFWYGGQLVSFGEYSSGQFYTVFIAIIFSGEAAAAFFTYTTSMTKATSAANYIFRVRDSVPPETQDDRPPRSEKQCAGAKSVDCRDLVFSYPQRLDVKVLKGVSANIQPGQFVAFVGASGCGKTTMISLLERFYDPTSGTVVFDGVDFRQIHVGQYRSSIALVQQEPVLYQGSIRDNIALGVVDPPDARLDSVPDDEILEACRQANIDTFIASLPDGLSTPCGSQGLSLSGGQRQRIAIARALIRKPGLLLLDEATSSLDTESERVVQAALDAAAKGVEDGEGRRRTTVAVAHRLSTIKGADRILVFSHGRIVEAGTHEELLDKQEMYYEMCLGQTLDRSA
ncbi:P-loop containing nucleoside triphosphate hydrolase protein [Podospora appendiculata]|uniref:P-loop containing nucleoside triphosphate hydrolase protein n=1 Tax=Podospora appendiculata TaxID=314037 RepID=A0AAE1CIR1_9PEZI|nr:P-loop containing nucleoside triphosphate hydrolase protein [Podospora appendiculata]